MSAVGLMVRKDLRRLAAPVACWLAFQAGGLVWFARAPGFLPDDPNTWRFGLGLWVELSAWVQFLFGALLTGVLVLEDPVRGSDVFWRTRPISGARLLAAKATAAGLLLVLAPVLVLGVVILVSCASKFGATFLAARATGLPWKESACIGLLMNTRALMALVMRSCWRGQDTARSERALRGGHSA